MERRWWWISLGKRRTHMILTTIDGIQLYETLQEAGEYAAVRGWSGYHTQVCEGVTGDMGGESHGSVVRKTRKRKQLKNNTNSSSGGGG